MGAYQIIGRIGEVVYHLELSLSLSGLHDIFNISQLRKFVPDTFHPMLLEIIEVESDISFEQQSSCILEHTSRSLRNKKIPLVKFPGE